MTKLKRTINLRWLVVLSLIVILAGWTQFTTAQEKKTTDQAQQRMELWKKYNCPGEKHNHLNYFVGDWDSVQKIFPRNGGEPVTLKQEVQVEPIYDGRFTRAHIKVDTTVMGKAPEGTIITGYDNYLDKVVSVSYGNMGTDISRLTGTLESDGKIRIDKGTRTDYFTGEEYSIRAVTTIINQDTYRYEYYRTFSSGDERRTMEIIYTRRKK